MKLIARDRCEFPTSGYFCKVITISFLLVKVYIQFGKAMLLKIVPIITIFYGSITGSISVKYQRGVFLINSKGLGDLYEIK